MYIIAQDGSGDFTTVQQAIDAVPSGDRAPAILLIRSGVYRERVIVHRDNLRIIGEDPEKTIITWSGCAKDTYPDGREKGTFLSATLLVLGDDVTVEGLTVRNDAGDGRDVGQAVAVYAAGDRGVWRNVRMIAHQDTLFCGPLMPKVEADIAPYSSTAECVESVGDCPLTHSRQYFENCFIQGDIDFIFGPYRCWFESCTLHMNARGGWYTAANTPEEQPYGLIFHRCTLTGECEAGKAFLGRPWRRFARTLFLECAMDDCVAPQGFRDWDDVRVITARCGEWRTRGADMTLRHPAQKRLTEEEALCVTLPEVIGGWDGWRPDQPTSTWFLCGDSTMANYPPSRSPMTGWGQKLQAQLLENAYVENCAVCGRSSKSFIDEQRLTWVDLCLRPGDKLVISFGHNDEKEDPLRHTDPDTTFPEYLNRYIDTALRHGAEPILATPIARRHFDENGKLLATHGRYPDVIRFLAVQRGLRWADLESETMRLLQQSGPDDSKAYFCHVPAGYPNYPNGAADNSHLHERGAARVAALFLHLIAGGNNQAKSGKTMRTASLEERTALNDAEDKMIQ